jgi:PPE-repeat protein
VNVHTNEQFATSVQTFAQSTGTPYPMKFLLLGRSSRPLSALRLCGVALLVNPVHAETGSSSTITTFARAANIAVVLSLLEGSTNPNDCNEAANTSLLSGIGKPLNQDTLDVRVPTQTTMDDLLGADVPRGLFDNCGLGAMNVGCDSGAQGGRHEGGQRGSFNTRIFLLSYPLNLFSPCFKVSSR